MKNFLSKIHAKTAILWVLLVAGTFLIWSIMMEFGYQGDDVLNAEFRGACLNEGQSFFELAHGIEKGWRDGGRLFPLTFYTTYGLFYLLGVQNWMQYKLLLIILGLVAALITGNFAQEATGKKEWQYYAVWLVPMLVSISAGTPSNGWGGSYILCVIWGLGGGYCLAEISSYRRKALAGPLAAFAGMCHADLRGRLSVPAVGFCLCVL